MWQARTGIEVIKWKWAWPEKAVHVKNFAGRMWSGGAREHYASEISDMKLLPTSKQDQSFNNKKSQLTLI